MARHDEVSVRHLGSGKYGDVFSVRDQAGGHRVAMKVSYYRDCTLSDVARCARRGDMEAALAAKRADAVSVSSQFCRVTARLVGGVSPHFVVVYTDTDCDGLAERLRHLLAARLAALTPVQRRHTNVCFMERFDGSLTDWLTRAPRLDDRVVRGIVFQVLYTLACLQRVLPGFRHNDLSTNNVLVRVAARQAVEATYVFRGAAFHVRGLPVLVALTDYDFVHVPGHALLSNERITGGRYPRMGPGPNASYDAHLFLKSVQRCLRRRGPAAGAGGGTPQTEQFLESLRLSAEDRETAELAHCVPAALLRRPYFEALRGRGPPHWPVYACS